MKITEKEYEKECKREPSCYCETYHRVLGLVSQTPECLRRYFQLYAKKEFAEEILRWTEDWFEKKRKSNEMWVLNQDELTGLFEEELKKKVTMKRHNRKVIKNVK